MHNYWLKQNKIEGYYIPIKVEDNKLEETIYSLKDMGFLELMLLFHIK